MSEHWNLCEGYFRSVNVYFFIKASRLDTSPSKCLLKGLKNVDTFYFFFQDGSWDFHLVFLPPQLLRVFNIGLDFRDDVWAYNTQWVLLAYAYYQFVVHVMLCYICSSFVIGQNIAKLFDIHLKENIYYRKIKFHMHTHMEIKTPKLTPAHNTITIHLNNHIKSYPKPNILKNPISCFRITILKLLKCKRPITTWTILKLMSISTHKYSAERLCCMTVAQLNMLYIRFLQVTWKQKGKCPVTASVDVGHAVKMRHRSDMYTFLWKNARIFLRFSAPLPSQTKKKKVYWPATLKLHPTLWLLENLFSSGISRPMEGNSWSTWKTS